LRGIELWMESSAASDCRLRPAAAAARCAASITRFGRVRGEPVGAFPRQARDPQSVSAGRHAHHQIRAGQCESPRRRTAPRLDVEHGTMTVNASLQRSLQRADIVGDRRPDLRGRIDRGLRILQPCPVSTATMVCPAKLRFSSARRSNRLPAPRSQARRRRRPRWKGAGRRRGSRRRSPRRRARPSRVAPPLRLPRGRVADANGGRDGLGLGDRCAETSGAAPVAWNPSMTGRRGPSSQKPRQ